MKKNNLLKFVLYLAAIFILAGCGANKKQTPSDFFSVESGIYQEDFELVLNGDGQDIYYTLDGSDPVSSNTAKIYDEPILITDRSGEPNYMAAVDPTLFTANYCDYSESKGLDCYIDAPDENAVDKCTVVRAVIKYSDGTYGDVVTRTYFVGSTSEHISGLEESCSAGGRLAVISIAVNYEDFFDNESGIYVRGSIFEEKLEDALEVGTEARKVTANYTQRGREWERAAHVDIFEADENGMSAVLSQDCGIRIQGNYSRSDLQKSFRLYAREDYGESKFNYAIWGDACQDKDGKTIDSFDTFVLRNGGNLAFGAKFNDTYWQSLISDGNMNVQTKTSRAAVVYINGEYWGLYVLEEDYDDDYFEDHFDVDKENVVLYKGDAETYRCGYKLDLGEAPENQWDSYYFDELTNFFRNHDDLKNADDYAEFCEIVDEKSVMDYFAAQIWMNNKWDWPGKNWSMWKTLETQDGNEYADGRWRFCMYDLDFGGVCGEGEAQDDTIKVDNYKPNGLLDMDTSNPAVLCFAYLMTNDAFAEAFYDRLNECSTVIFNYDTAYDRMQEFIGIYGPLYDQFFARYNVTSDIGSKDSALYGGYGSAKCIMDFIEKRADCISGLYLNN